MRYLLAIWLMVSPAFACDPRPVVLTKAKSYRVLFRGLSENGSLLEIYRNEKTRIWFASITDQNGSMCVLIKGRGFETMPFGMPVSAFFMDQVLMPD